MIDEKGKAAVILPIIYYMESGGMWNTLFTRFNHQGISIYQSAKLAKDMYPDELFHYMGDTGGGIYL